MLNMHSRYKKRNRYFIKLKPRGNIMYNRNNTEKYRSIKANKTIYIMLFSNILNCFTTFLESSPSLPFTLYNRHNVYNI